jgi:hypothetical protein
MSDQNGTNKKARSKGAQTTGTITGSTFVGAPGSHAAIAIGPGVSGSILVSDSIARGSHYGIVQGSPLAQCREVDKETLMKIIQSGQTHIHGDHTGISVPEGSNSEVHLRDTARVTGGVYGIEERRRTVEAVKAIAPLGTPADAIDDAIEAVRATRSGTAEEQEQAVKKSRIWAVLKDSGPDVLGFLIKTVLKSLD